MTLRHDVAIVGAGPVGAALALTLATSDLDVVVLDARAEQTIVRGERSLALSHGARLILERLGVWSELAARGDAVTAIGEIDISQAGGFGTARLAARDHGLSALGYVVSYRALQATLDRALARTGIDVRYGARVEHVGGTRAYAAVSSAGLDAVIARLAIVADGGGARVAGIARTRHEYAQSALVGKVWCREPHGGVAFERFTATGPVALLPEQDHYALIWTAAPAVVEALLGLPDAPFLERLAAHFGRRRGGFVAVAERRSFPLALDFVSAVTATRTVVIGNAAQALHPVAGQGFNLGLRDAYELGCLVRDAPRAAIGDPSMLAAYARARRTDRFAGVAFTHGLVGIFSNDHWWLRWPRGAALAGLDAFRPAKSAFTRAMLFGLR